MLPKLIGVLISEYAPDTMPSILSK